LQQQDDSILQNEIEPEGTPDNSQAQTSAIKLPLLRKSTKKSSGRNSKENSDFDAFGMFRSDDKKE